MKRLLIANRGEIACRIVRTARRMGIESVAVFSAADRDALHVRAADHAECVGGAAADESYLDGAAILEAARCSGADAVHPGYGFLSENADFARACTQAGLIFVGPDAETIAAMGDKARAKKIAEQAGVPTVPGYSGEGQTVAALSQEAARIGFPLMVKAVAGGGGRGMRQVREAGSLAAALESARREAEAAFGDGDLLLERLVEDARHVEVQIFGDRRGGVVHLGERDCSAQRRHQKIIEEAPSPFADEKLRERLTGDAVRLARAAGYVGAGTVEFVVSADRSHFFLEMNTRLQVEHPVTEMVTGLDLVEWQIRVAQGETLPLRQEEIRFAGHAIEARLYAEDPSAGFLPQAGRIARWRAPAVDRVRIDAGIEEGSSVPPHYDPMIAKLVAHGDSRTAALERLHTTLARLEVAGLRTNQRFLLDLVDSPEFTAGAMTTATVDGWIEAQAPIVRPPAAERENRILSALVRADAGGDWFRSSGVAICPVEFEDEDGRSRIDIVFARGKPVRALTGDDAVEIADVRIGEGRIACRLGGRAVSAWLCEIDGRLWLGREGAAIGLAEPDYLAADAGQGAQGLVTAPLAGVVRAVFVTAGERVVCGAPLVAIEAMKMETVINAAFDARVKSVAAAPGTPVGMREALLELEPDPERR